MADTTRPKYEIARIGRNEKEMNVSIADFTMRLSVQDERPAWRGGRWYGTCVSRKPDHAMRPNVRRLRSAHWRNVSTILREIRQKLPVPPFGYVGIAKRRTSA